MTKTSNCTGTEIQGPALRSVVFKSMLSETNQNNSNDPVSHNHHLELQNSRPTSIQESENNSRSADKNMSNGLDKPTLPGIDYVFREDSSGDTLLHNVYSISRRSPPQAPVSIVTYASNSEHQLLSGEPVDHSNHSQETPGRPVIPSPIISEPEDLGRPLIVICIGMKMVDGEMCYIYSDGTCCPAYVNGEWVNPEFGLTKDGKPRKRLRKACINCNSKKVRCQPGYPKCGQCEKTQVECE